MWFLTKINITTYELFLLKKKSKSNLKLVKALDLATTSWEIPLKSCLHQRFSTNVPHGRHTGVPQEFLRYAILDCLVRATDLFFP